MIYLLVGEDKYRLDVRLKELEAAVGENRELNLRVFDSVFDFSTIKNEVCTLPFLSDKKVVVLKNFFAAKNKELIKSFAELLSTIPEQCDVVIVEDEALKPQYLKIFDKKVHIETYSRLNPRETTAWIKNKSVDLGGKISDRTAEKLSATIGNDLYRIENELKKLIAYSPEITDEIVDNMIEPDFNESVFALIDSISVKNPKKALTLLNGFLDNEENEIYLLTMLARQVRNLLIIKDLTDRSKNELAVVTETGFHPYVVKKTISQAKNFEISKLINLHEAILDADLEFKTTSSDPRLILSKLIINFTT